MALVVMVTAHLLLLATSFFPQFSLWGPEVRRFQTSRKQVCLTIDDGPCSDTMAMLDVLDQAQLTAIFCLIGERVEAHPEWCSAIVERGHVVANHTHTHPSAWFWSYLPSAQRRELTSCSQVVALAASRLPKLFRAPAGFRNLFTAGVIREQGMCYLGWSRRGYDTRETDLDRIMARLRRGFQPGAILLIHQGMPHHVPLLRRLLEELQADGWEVVIPMELRPSLPMKSGVSND